MDILTSLFGIGLTDIVHNKFFSQPNEFEADELGMSLAKKAGFNTEKGLGLFAKFSKLGVEGKNPFADLLSQYFSTHPLSIERLDKAKEIQLKYKNIPIIEEEINKKKGKRILKLFMFLEEKK